MNFLLFIFFALPGKRINLFCAIPKTNEKIEASCFQDSTLHQRFVFSLFQEYEQEGRWLFLSIDSCDERKWYELVNPSSIIDAYSKTYKGMDKDNLIFTASETFRVAAENGRNEFFDRGDPCRADTLYGIVRVNYYIQGIKVNMNCYREFKKLSINKILHTYFDKNKELKKKYNKFLYELIAVCYTNNIKVITLKNRRPYYEVFK
jgi:hypothetical protein